ncbi:hypothetical protein MKX03_017219 [Papaver bracteatum]|nr:hypothetical protein MKX03_017219 [Papaver bracteatum]
MRNSLLGCHGANTSSGQKLECSKYQDGLMDLMMVIGIGNEGLGFVFDRGKAAEISYETLDNISCLLSFTISEMRCFVFDRGKDNKRKIQERILFELGRIMK